MSNIDVIADYVGMVKNQTQLIKLANSDPKAPVDAAISLEADLKRYQDRTRDAIIFALASHILEQVGE